MRIFINHAPPPFETFRCTHPGCHAIARGIVQLTHLPKNITPRTRAYCTTHTNARIMHHGDRRVQQTIQGHLVRRPIQAHGGWHGWEYALVIPPSEAADRDDCERLLQTARAYSRSCERHP